MLKNIIFLFVSTNGIRFRRTRVAAQVDPSALSLEQKKQIFSGGKAASTVPEPAQPTLIVSSGNARKVYDDHLLKDKTDAIAADNARHNNINVSSGNTRKVYDAHVDEKNNDDFAKAAAAGEEIFSARDRYTGNRFVSDGYGVERRVLKSGEIKSRIERIDVQKMVQDNYTIYKCDRVKLIKPFGVTGTPFTECETWVVLLSVSKAHGQEPGKTDWINPKTSSEVVPDGVKEKASAQSFQEKLNKDKKMVSFAKMRPSSADNKGDWGLIWYKIEAESDTYDVEIPGFEEQVEDFKDAGNSRCRIQECVKFNMDHGVCQEWVEFEWFDKDTQKWEKAENIDNKRVGKEITEADLVQKHNTSVEHPDQGEKYVQDVKKICCPFPNSPRCNKE